MEGYKALQFPQGAMYRIICRANQYALAIEDRVNHKMARVIGEFQNPQDIAQLWFLTQIKNQDFEIVNALSSFCFDEEKGEIRLKKGEQKNDQLFAIERVPGEGYHEWFWIKTKAGGSKTVSLDGVLTYRELEKHSQSQMFRFEPFIANVVIDKTSIITNTHSGKVIDVPEASRKEGQKVIQYSKNRRFNQRWVFEQVPAGIIIKNFHSGLVLDVEYSNKKAGTVILQWTQNNGLSQLWRFQDKGNNNFIIRSHLEPKWMLGVQGDSVDNSKKLVMDKHVTIWHIEGKLPPYEM